MAITQLPERQAPLVAIVSFTYSDFVSGSDIDAIQIPANAIVTSGFLVIDTAFNSATSDTLTVGDSADNDRYKGSINGQTAALTALVPTGKKYTAQDDITVRWTGAGTAPSAGAGRLVVEYVVDGRAQVSQG